MRSLVFGSRISFLSSAAGLVALFAFARPAASHVSADVRGGYHTDTESGLIGGGINTDISPSWYFNPNVEWVFVDGNDLWSVNADFHHDFPTSGPAVWLGLGPALVITDRDPNGPSDTDPALNLLGGIGAKQGSVRPYGQMKLTLADNSSSEIVFGLRF